MTEAEWVNGSDATGMLHFIRRSASERKLRLYACACCRWGPVWHLLTDARSRHAVDVAELYADGKVSAGELESAWDGAGAAAEGMTGAAGSAASAAREVAGAAAWYAARDAAAAAAMTAAWSAAREAQVVLLREMFGNPVHLFGPVPMARPVRVDPTWLTRAVVSLARCIYGERDFAALPVLADALEEAGCDNAEILAHCRSGGEHARGCWVVDALLGKE